MYLHTINVFFFKSTMCALFYFRVQLSYVLFTHMTWLQSPKETSPFIYRLRAFLVVRLLLLRMQLQLLSRAILGKYYLFTRKCGEKYCMSHVRYSNYKHQLRAIDLRLRASDRISSVISYLLPLRRNVVLSQACYFYLNDA